MSTDEAHRFIEFITAREERMMSTRVRDAHAHGFRVDEGELKIVVNAVRKHLDRKKKSGLKMTAYKPITIDVLADYLPWHERHPRKSP